MPNSELPWTKKLYRKANSYWASLTKEAVAWHVIGLLIVLPLILFAGNIFFWLLECIITSANPLIGFCFLLLGAGVVGGIVMTMITDL